MSSSTEVPLIWGDGETKVSRRSMVDEVRERLTAWIHSGRLKVDAQLPSENELARIFGVSRPVIREALVGLQALGITVPRTGKGTFVASGQVKPELLLGGYGAEHLTEVRRLLEVPAARLAAERRNSQDLARMTALLRAMAEQGDARQRNKLDAEFHIAIAATSGNPLLAKLVGDLRAVLEQVSFLASYLTYRRDSAQAEHQAIFDAISQREAGRAEAAMSAHLSAIDKSMAAIRRRLMRQQDEPEARQRTTAVGAPVAPKNDETKRNRTQTTPRVGKEAKNAK